MRMLLFIMSDLVNSLTIMWQGMLTIFIVMCLIAAIVALTARGASRKQSGKDD